MILDAFWFFLPAGIANMSPVLANKIPGLNQWNTPIDFGKTYHDQRIFGDHKTWRGLSFGVAVGILTALLLHKTLYTYAVSPVLAGFLLSFGALAGDAVKSFFKRRVSIRPGSSWFPFDQADYIFGALLLSYYFLKPTAVFIATIFVLYFGLHLVTSYLGYLLGLKDKPI